MENQYIEEVNQEHKHTVFMTILRKHSENKEDPVSEWVEEGRFDSGERYEGTKRCICTTPIDIVYYIKNKKSGIVLEIGSTCINRWWDIYCINCNCALGNKIKRRKQEKDGEEYALWCPECKKIDIEEKEKYKKHLGNYKLYYPGPYKGKKFSGIIKDINYINQLVSLPEERKTPSLKKFEEYIQLSFDIVNA